LATRLPASRRRRRRRKSKRKRKGKRKRKKRGSMCVTVQKFCGNRYKSSAVAEMGDRGHSRHGRKEGGGCPST